MISAGAHYHHEIAYSHQYLVPHLGSYEHQTATSKSLKEDEDHLKQGSSMPPSETESRHAANESELKVVRIAKGIEGEEFIVEHQKTGNICAISDTFAEMFSMWAGRILVTAENDSWTMTAAKNATGFGTSIIMSPAEAGIEAHVSADKTPDGRVGVFIQIYHQTRLDLKAQMIMRIGQCVMTCPTTAAFDALPEAKRRLKVGRSLRYFGDGFQKRDTMYERNVWRIPVMEGEFIVEDRFGAAKAIGGGNFLIMAENMKAGLQAAEDSVEAINHLNEKIILPFPGGICRSGSKAGSLKYKLKASTFHQFCPRLKRLVPDTKVPPNVNSVYEIVIDGLSLQAIKQGLAAGINAAVKVPGVVRISAGNYGGKLGPHKAELKEILNLWKERGA